MRPEHWTGWGPHSRHIVARFILIGLYSGTRAAAIAAASPKKGAGHSYVDLDNGIFYRLPEGHAETKKRQPPIPVPPRLLAHMRRVAEHFVEWHGAGVRSVKTAFKTAVRLARLPGKVTPHTRRHTAATWLMQFSPHDPYAYKRKTASPRRASAVE